MKYVITIMLVKNIKRIITRIPKESLIQGSPYGKNTSTTEYIHWVMQRNKLNYTFNQNSLYHKV